MSDDLPDRKQKHLEICLDQNRDIESGSTGLQSISLPHRALPETHADQVDLDTEFLGYTLTLPVMISCMTGGSEDGRRLNRLLAEVAGERKLAIGTGSIRVMLRHPDTKSHFDLKSLVPDSPLIANIGAAQLTEYSPKDILDAVDSIEADGLYVHLNPAQELFQENGDRNFQGWYDGFRRLLDRADRPILVKETGAGIPPLEGLRLLQEGVSYVDIAGMGGTDWVAVEAERLPPGHRTAADSFRNWGYTTGELLLAYRQISRAGGESGRAVSNRIIASGGLRSPRDFAVALSCGAWMGAAALPFIRAASTGGKEGVEHYLDDLKVGIRAAVVLTGAGDLENLRGLDLRVPVTMASAAESLAEEALADRKGGRNQP